MLGNSVSRATSTSHDFCQFEEKTCGNGHDLKRDNKRIRVDTHSGKVRFLRRLNLDQLNDQGETLLTQAVRDGDMQMAQRLLERGASPYVRNSHGDTAGDIARSLSSLPDASPVPDARSRSLSSWPLFNIASLLRDAQGLSHVADQQNYGIIERPIRQVVCNVIYKLMEPASVITVYNYPSGRIMQRDLTWFFSLRLRSPTSYFLITLLLDISSVPYGCT
eukprot:g14965.t1